METLAPPWLDLPAHLSDDILERLPLSDYARFPAVCRRWRSVQTSHRRRHSPYPPPMLPLPWLVETLESGPSSCLLSCYSPFEDASFSLPLPSPSSSLDLSVFSRGWTLSFDDLGNPSLFHPISASAIDLPPLITPPSESDSYVPFAITLVDRASGIAVQIPPSVPRRCGSFTISPPPNYAVSTIAFGSSGVRIFLLRRSDPSWLELELPSGVGAEGLTTMRQTVSIRGKHYHLCVESRDAGPYNVLVVHALTTPPTLAHFDMMPLPPMPRQTGFVRGSAHFLELDGELLLVREVVKVDDWKATVGFQVFRADLDRRMWVEVRSLGDDRVLMIHTSRVVSLLAADIGAGRGNCIYFSTGMRHEQDVPQHSGEAPWKVFDLASRRVTDSVLPNASQMDKSLQQLFVPTLC